MSPVSAREDDARRPAGALRRHGFWAALALAWTGAVCAQAASGDDLPPVPGMPQATASAPGPAPQRAADPNLIRVLLSADVETTLAAQMVGRIDAIDVGLGDRVQQGQRLVAFDCAETDARLKMAQAESAAARETLGVKQRLRKLEAAGDSEVILARIEAQKAAAAIELAQAQLAYCEVKAPFDGHVVKLHARPHQSVNVGAPLLELVNEQSLKLRMNVPSQMLRSIQPGSAVEVDILETGQAYPARVSAINARVDAVAQTIELEARLDGDFPELLPGMSGVARFGEP